ncbi:MAG: NfeD family protein [Pirellulales bacterium]
MEREPFSMHSVSGHSVSGRPTRVCRRAHGSLAETLLFLPLALLFLAEFVTPAALAQAGKDEKGKAAGNDGAASKERRAGRLIRVAAPITDKVDYRVKRLVDETIRQAKEKGEWPVLIFEIHPGRSEFGQAVDLARYLSSPALNGATTVAYLPGTVTGHAVLVAMACDEIIMHEEAEIGSAGEAESVIEPSVRSAYVEIANRRKTVPTDLALKMLDPSKELLVVETDVSREYVLAERLAALRKKKSVVSSKVLIPAGKAGVFSGSQARELGFVSYLAAERTDVAKALGLPNKAVEEDVSDGELRPVRIALKGPISAATAGQVQNMIQNQIRDNDVNFICVWIDSPGGSPLDSINLANFLAGLDSTQRRTVAYIPSEARADAAFVALACDQIVMHPRAVLGGPGAIDIPKADVQVTVQSVMGIAEQKRRSPALAAAMVDPNLTVHRYTRQTDGLDDYFSEADLAALDDAKQWRRGERITTPGQPLRLDGATAEQLGVARDVVNDFNEFKALYGLEDDPTLVEPGWADYLIDALNSPGISWFLLLLGGAALYAELQSPGIGLGGLIAGLCFLLYFWSAYLGGTAGWLEVLLFGAGMVCLLLEIFVLPGFGLFGLAGGLLVICSLILASQTFILPRNEYQLAQLRNHLFVLCGAGVGTVAAAALMRRYLPHAPVFNRMLLAPPSEEESSAIAEREAMTRLDHLLGSRGESSTPLVPGGKARFGDQFVDVMADGGFVERGKPIEVIEVRGSRVVVREIT